LSTVGSTLISIVLWSFTAGNILADSPEKPNLVEPARAALLDVPLSFVANQGQTDSQVKFLSRGDGYSLFLTSNEAVFTLRTPAGAKAPPTVFRMELRGANRGARVTGADKLAGVANYYLGNDPAKWRSGITTYGRVKYEGIYPGVDAAFYGNQRQLEYDFVIAPGADPRQISLRLNGAKPSLDADGNVVLKMADGDLALKKPVVYQNVAGEKKFVEADYTLAGNQVRFHLGKYDHHQTLVIDPVFTYLTYLGGSSVDYIGGATGVGQIASPNQALAIDSAGNVYVAGQTLSTDFPVVNAYQSTTKTPGYSAFVSALNPTGTALLFSTYLGGSISNGGNPGSDLASSIAWDSFDNAVYVVGTATNSDFPTTPGAFQTLNPQGRYFPFVAKFSAGGKLTNSTFLAAGGASYEYGLGVAADSLGRAYAVGFTSYSGCTAKATQNCFPTTPGAVISGSSLVVDTNSGNGFVSVLDKNLSTLLYSTLLGDPNGASNGYGTEAFGVTVDPNGNFYVVGQTGAATLPVTPGVFQTSLATSNGVPVVGFAAKFGPVSTSGASLIYLTYVEATGLSYGDLPGGVAADSQGNAYIGGYTNSPTFPVTTGAYNTPCPLNGARLCPAAFVTKLNPTGTYLVWSALVEPADFFSSIQLDAQGNVYVAGHNAGAGSFVPVNPVQTGLNNGGGFVAKLDPTGSTLQFSSLIQGGFTLKGLAVDAQGNIYVASYTYDTTLPTTPGAFQPALKNPGTGNSYDGFIAKIALGPPTTTLPHVADGNGFDTLILLINTGTADANYSLQFFNQSGAQVTYQLDPSQSGMTGTIHAGSQAIVRTAGSGTSTNLGWGQLTAPASVQGMLIYQQQASPTSFQEGSAPLTSPSTHFFVPFDNTGGSTTSIGFVNPSPSQAAIVNLTVRYASGGTDNVPAFNMNPLQQIANPVTTIWANTAGQRGMIEVNAFVPIGLVAFRFQGSAFTLVDTIAPTAGGSTPVTSTIAHTADGNNFKSTFLLTNSGAAAAPYTLSILNATGQPQTFGFDVASPLSGTVPAGSTLTIDTTGLGSVTNLGWAQLSAAPAVSGIEVFRQTNPGKSEQQGTIPITQTNPSHFFLPFDNAANTTSIALANPDPAITATINVTFRYTDGTSNTGQLTLSPRNYLANQLASLFTATAVKAGVAEFTSNVPVAVVEVRFNPTQAFTSLRAVSP